jgi:prephenate dehydratase
MITALESRQRTNPRVAFQGEPGAFSEEALLTYFADEATPVPCRQFSDVAAAVQRGNCDFGLLPIENSTVGGVSAACDVLALSPLQVVGEVICLVRHCLLARPGTEQSRLRRVLSHPVALGQCETFFREHPAIEAVASYDTAGAARLQARPGRTPWSYWFFLEVEGTRSSLHTALERLVDYPVTLHVLGSYPRWPSSTVAGCRTDQ